MLSKYKNINVILIYDPEDINSEIETVQTPDEIINNPKIDAIYICTPNYLNKMLTIQSLKAGKHVFCEKPPAFTAKDVEEIRTFEEQSGKVLMYGLNHRHHASVKHMKVD